MNLFQTKNALRGRAAEPPSRGAKDPRLVSLLSPASPAAEAYRELRTNLLYSSGSEQSPGVIVLTSPEPGVARSLASANLSVALAQAGRSTVLVDCDLRNPNQSRIFGSDADENWSAEELFTEDLSLLDECHEPVPGLKLLAAKGSISDPTAVLESESFAEFLRGLRGECDHVLIDAPCMEQFSDAISLATQSDGALLVLESRKSRKAAVRKSVRRLRSAAVNVIGTVAVNV